jgi:hypothetical protein
MQLVVWVLFAANLGLAAMVIQWKQQQSRVELSPPQQLAGLEVRLPAGWMTRAGVRDGTRFIVAAEQQGGPLAGTLAITRSSVPFNTTALDVLSGSVLDPPSRRGSAPVVRKVRFAVGEGILAEQQQRQRAPGGPPVTRNVVAAAIITDEGEAIVIQFSGSDSASGRELVEEVAQSLKVVTVAPLAMPDDDAV